MANFFIAIKLLLSSKKKHNKELFSILGYIPRNKKLYELAFLHRSASAITNNKPLMNNERLEFLGDAVLGSIVAEYLFSQYPNKNEGFLSTMRSKIVKRNQLNSIAIKMGIDKLIVSNIFTNSKNVFGNALEALIGAVYLDKGYNFTKKYVIEKVLKIHIDLKQLEYHETDFKSRVIEWAQKNRMDIKFECKEEYSEKDNAAIFVSTIMVANQSMGQGRGFSKKEAEQNAAEQTFNAISSI